MYALVDCNNFYASCERLFRPDLKTRPVVVLSNNDGCVVARSQEAKRLGIKMGVPAFKVRNLLNKHEVATFSSNYALYADISSRVMSTLEAMAPNVEVYSIDEAFLDLNGFSRHRGLEAYGRDVKHTVHKHVGITVGVGIGPTKTLAKLANYAAKHYSATRGVVELSDRSRQRKLMSLVKTEEVWGIGSKLSKRLTGLGIHTALDFADARPSLIRKHGSVVLQRTQAELNGEACQSLELQAPTKQQIVCSRSFSQRITDLDSMRQTVCQYTTRAAEKLRGERQWAKRVLVFMRTSGFAQQEPYYSNSASTHLCYPSDDTRDLIHAAMSLVDAIWKPGYRYSKAGIMLADFHEPGSVQMDLFEPDVARPKSRSLMATLDKINHSGLGSIFFARQGIQQPWKMQRQLLSPSYTTHWKDLPVVR